MKPNLGRNSNSNRHIKMSSYQRKLHLKKQIREPVLGLPLLKPRELKNRKNIK